MPHRVHHPECGKCVRRQSPSSCRSNSTGSLVLSAFSGIGYAIVVDPRFLYDTGMRKVLCLLPLIAMSALCADHASVSLKPRMHTQIQTSVFNFTFTTAVPLWPSHVTHSDTQDDIRPVAVMPSLYITPRLLWAQDSHGPSLPPDPWVGCCPPGFCSVCPDPCTGTLSDPCAQAKKGDVIKPKAPQIPKKS